MYKLKQDLACIKLKKGQLVHISNFQHYGTGPFEFNVTVPPALVPCAVLAASDQQDFENMFERVGDPEIDWVEEEEVTHD